MGGAHTVTGSKYLLEIDEFRLLVDCGLFQGLKPLRLMNWDEFPVDPSTIDAVILTHAHIDHTGYVPKLVKEGFKGSIYCTEATSSLLEIMLIDSAKLQEEEAEWAEKKGYSKHDNPKALYTTKDAQLALTLLSSCEYETPISLSKQLSFSFFNAGHILGSAIVQVTLIGESQNKVITFSGDLGPENHPLLSPPVKLKETDILLVESTYGDRDKEDHDILNELKNVVIESIENDGCLLIPAFAVGRTQALMYYLQKLVASNQIPPIPIYIDSPMAINATSVYKRNAKYHTIDLEAGSGISFLNFPELHYYQNQEASVSLNNLKKNAIIISASGMCTGGRILHHLYNRLSNKNDIVLFVGYQAEGTRGRNILEGDKSIRIFGIEVPVKCHVRTIEGLSAHADRTELLSWVSNFETPPKMTFIVHGEFESATAFSKSIKKEFGWNNVYIPDYLESYELFDGI